MSLSAICLTKSKPLFRHLPLADQLRLSAVNKHFCTALYETVTGVELTGLTVSLARAVQFARQLSHLRLFSTAGAMFQEWLPDDWSSTQLQHLDLTGCSSLPSFDIPAADSLLVRFPNLTALHTGGPFRWSI
eukprot:TRINITY_DN4528_c0_g1_i1.p1 TRINITY_DN4528_c0_g1~~TRINITY_DN4528_c0_g1_i1.p1  ORF type:complete len:132 (-),score=17.63 TRINITY_DN4528_c0_g1_i1:478-873(-)